VDDEDQEEVSHILPPLKKGMVLDRREIQSIERFSQGPQRYTEASLVHKLEELGIGRPSTYAPTISTIQQREYVHKGDKTGEERSYTIDTLKGKQIKQSLRKEMAGSDKGKLLPTDIGIVVNDFLMKYFPSIMDYNFTAKVEQDFDKIAEGKEQWSHMMKSFYKNFAPVVEKTMNARQERKAGERQLGIDPKSGKPVFVKIGRFGPVVQIGSADDKDKPLFAQMPSEKSMEAITLEEALELFKLPRTLGDFEGSPVVIGAGRFGPYILHQKKYTSLSKDADPLTITLDESIRMILEKRLQESQKHMKTFEEDSKLEVLNGRYGPYLAYDGKNYRLLKSQQAKAADLTYDECMAIIEKQKK
jgi:DNA topoisomerase-1